MRNITQKFLDLYFSNLDLICENLGYSVNSARREAIENFNIGGIPNSKSKKFKHIDMQNIFEQDYEKYFVSTIPDNIEDMFSCNVDNLDTYKILLLNGFYPFKDERLFAFPNGIIIGSFAEASLKYPEIFDKYYNQICDNINESFVALNTAFVQDGIFIYIPQNVVVDKPIQIINVLSDNKPIMAQYRNLFVIEKNAKANILICDHTVLENKFLANCVSEMYIGENADVEVVRLQNEHNQSSHLSFFYAKQQINSNYVDNTITLNGGVVANSIKTMIDGEGCSNNTYGLYLVDKSQYISNYTDIRHNAPNCSSNELFRGVLDEKGIGVFKGMIYVSPHADKTEAYQSNNNILLTDTAKVYTRPQLEIYADDVKCSHGATVGSLDEEAIFYMRQRGIELKEARLLQMYGFAYSVIQKINLEPLRNRVALLVNKRLRGELNNCICCGNKC